MRNDICTLVTLTADGSEVEPMENEVFCEKSSCTRSEFYQAYAVGLSPKLTLEIDPEDYENASVIQSEQIVNPQQVMYKGARYNILRSYQKDESTLSLTVG
jgi:hypothetical protein